MKPQARPAHKTLTSTVNGPTISVVVGFSWQARPEVKDNQVEHNPYHYTVEGDLGPGITIDLFYAGSERLESLGDKEAQVLQSRIVALQGHSPK